MNDVNYNIITSTSTWVNMKYFNILVKIYLSHTPIITHSNNFLIIYTQKMFLSLYYKKKKSISRYNKKRKTYLIL